VYRDILLLTWKDSYKNRNTASQQNRKTMTVTLMKSNYLKALEQCAVACSELIESNNKSEFQHICIQRAIACKDACIVCIDACESTEHSTRGQLMEKSKMACKAFLESCDTIQDPKCQKVSEWCKVCIEECDNFMN